MLGCTLCAAAPLEPSANIEKTHDRGRAAAPKQFHHYVFCL